MNTFTEDSLEFRAEDLKAKLFKGFADPTRVAILEFLRSGEKCVGEIVTHLGCAQSRVSNHLACLRWCNFVTSRPSGQQVFYSIRDERILSMLALADGLLADNAEQVLRCTRM